MHAARLTHAPSTSDAGAHHEAACREQPAPSAARRDASRVHGTVGRKNTHGHYVSYAQLAQLGGQPLVDEIRRLGRTFGYEE